MQAPILWPPDANSHWKRPWCWERLKAGGESGDRGWDGWMASLTRWTWVWANPGKSMGSMQSMLQSMGSLSDWTTGSKSLCGPILCCLQESDHWFCLSSPDQVQGPKGHLFQVISLDPSPLPCLVVISVSLNIVLKSFLHSFMSSLFHTVL